MAMDVFQSAYAVFLPDNETMMYEILQLVPDLIANGASEPDLVDILLSRGKSEALGTAYCCLATAFRRGGSCACGDS